ncbi:MAG: hypothetical protein ABSD78_09480 [Acidimicrobiales bacterium]|jgi:hypothetical protein
MLEVQVIMYLFDVLTTRVAEARLNPARGDVAEKIVIVGVFVALAIAVGALITHAVTGDATRIAHSIAGAP